MMMEKNDKSSSRILLVEDDFINGKIVKTLCEKASYNIEWVRNGKEALDILLLRSEDFDLILMDIQMPIVNGYEVSASIRKEGIDVPIISMTANDYCDEKMRSEEAGMNDYIPKPVTRTALLEMIEKYL